MAEGDFGADSFQAEDVESFKFGAEFEGVQFLSNAEAAILLDAQNKTKYATSGQRAPECVNTMAFRFVALINSYNSSMQSVFQVAYVCVGYNGGCADTGPSCDRRTFHGLAGIGLF